jgi:hypothetical protein
VDLLETKSGTDHFEFLNVLLNVRDSTQCRLSLVKDKTLGYAVEHRTDGSGSSILGALSQQFGAKLLGRRW